MLLETSEEILVIELFKNSLEKKAISRSELLSLDKLVGDVSTRRYYRLVTENKTYVVCLSDPIVNKVLNENFVAVLNSFQVNKIETPALFDFDLEKGYFLQEDLGDETLLKLLGRVENDTEEYKWLELAIKELIKIHSIDHSKALNVTKGLSFDLEKLMAEVSFSIEHFLDGYLEASLTEKEKKVIIKSFDKICRRLASEKMVPTHRDYHTRNLMVKNDIIKVIDFQDMRMGIPQYDLVSILEDNYYLFSNENIERVKNIYWEDFLAPIKIQPSRDNFDELYRLMSAQRVFKALGTFGYISKLRDDARYLKYIGFAFEKLRALLHSVEGVSELKVLLCERYYER